VGTRRRRRRRQHHLLLLARQGALHDRRQHVRRHGRGRLAAAVAQRRRGNRCSCGCCCAWCACCCWRGKHCARRCLAGHAVGGAVLLLLLRVVSAVPSLDVAAA
jgi:hypothetical protein